jgi:serine/threonine protein kinase
VSFKVINMRPLGDDGAFGDVYIGNRDDNGEFVVVKFLRDDTPDNRRYFHREVRILNGGLHERLVAILGFNLAGPKPYYIMPYYPGGKLTPWAGRLTHRQLRAIIKQIGEPLAKLHSQQIVHGDVKPDNVLLTNAGDLRLGDPLGNGAGCTVMYRANQGGTPGYMAPEIARGSAMSAQGDVFSFGATLFHLVTGRRPEDGQNFDPRMCGVVVPDDIRNIILACCRVDPRRRPRMQQVLASLTQGDAVLQATSPKSAQGEDLIKTLLAAGGVVGMVALVASLLEGK